MKHKQKEPRRVQRAPAVKTSDGLGSHQGAPDGVFDEPEVKRIKSEPGVATESGCNKMDSCGWKWNITDFRKEYLGNPKGNSDGSKELSNDSTEHSNDLDQMPNDCKEVSKNSKESVKTLGICNGSSNQSAASFKDSVILCNKDNPKECDKTRKPEFYLRKPAHVFHSNNEYFQSWKLPVRNSKEGLSYTKTRQYPSEVISNPRVVEKSEKGMHFWNETRQNESMPVIIDVFSLSKASAKPVNLNPVPENSVLFTPPCSPPFVQFGNVRAASVTNQKTCLRSEFVNQTASQQLQENRYNFVQHGFENFQACTSTPLRQINSQSKQNQQVDYSYQKYLPHPVNQINPQDNLNNFVVQIDPHLRQIYPKQAQQLRPQEYPNKAAQQVCYNNLENMPRQIQQGYSAEYLNKPTQQVSFSNQENVTYPVQQGYCEENLVKPVQQIPCNPTKAYFAKSRQAVYAKDYVSNSIAQNNLSEDLSNRYQNTNPVNMQYFLYNPVQQNPQQIANGVLPLEKQTSNQNDVNTNQLRANTTKLPVSGSYINYEPKPTSQIKSKLYSSYYQDAANRANGQFKISQAMPDRNGTSQLGGDALSQFQTRAVQSTSRVDTVHSNQSESVTNQDNVSSTAEIVLSTPLTAQHASRLPTPPHYSFGIFAAKYRTDRDCSVVLNDFGENQVLSPKSSSRPNTNNDIYGVKQSEDSWGTLGIVSDKQLVFSENPNCSSTTKLTHSFPELPAGHSFTPRTLSSASGGQEKKSPGEFLSPRDAKLIKLKQRLEQQEATLKKLRGNH